MPKNEKQQTDIRKTLVEINAIIVTMLCWKRLIRKKSAPLTEKQIDEMLLKIHNIEKDLSVNETRWNPTDPTLY